MFRIELPPLRLRRDDIPPLVRHLAERCCGRLGRAAVPLTAEAKKIITSYSWPGNVCELMNAIEHALIVCDQEITPGDLPIDILAGDQSSTADDNALDLKSMERSHSIKVLNHTHGNKTEAARLLKIGLTTLYRKIEKYGITI